MRGVLVAASVALVVSLLGTPWVIKLFRRQGYGQEIREDGPSTHLKKRGTPTMGGTVIVIATLVGYFIAHLATGAGFTASGLLVIMVMAGLGVVGFLDDYIKIRKQRSLGLTARMKFAGQAAVALAFGLLAVRFKNSDGLLPGSTFISVVRDTEISVGIIGFPLLAWMIIAATSNAVNLTDGLDGLAAGTSAMVFGAYVVISFWQFGNLCSAGLEPGCYSVRDPLDVALVAAAAMGACFGFLWWNASPAKIFMGDTGSLALGGAFAAIAIVSRTELLLFVLGGLFVIETVSVILQVAGFKLTKKRIFNMAPIHHHFELAEWPETTVIIRFWIVSGLAVAFGLGLFYAEFLSHGGHL
ncbi:phospho-N-acetylmuramoyl-pentapeptide-transferase [Frankia sp. CNm7]|uniref:Phospho-N-acetylmuramoyl-pentapeptide-transferase n=1 Tax=Frankia nepalensis TaxID=1836974 RepID=A0A937RH82_9ACTN|nr:phospho-N-acetylmuramoyl-pentapeptide-transferase [Frankia nepalensis]MBL7500360.1 phospho-N-acetylmuramoyl-pentapeptide-transferase [Frankia nepalensis]MBL7515615.1 phospho-N-acetylmuramoyl-pentapeptide-transferase [Frankia nepalensis]MBL7519454.1 phospho-N-acetylmuramoyl-pentapeptide-transferase [Frankia nepalensis]MBL7628819.1 phospho-N-acetylmuramoyl-pentapeptide-transferase [Frankia nepalensis]